MLLRQHSNLPSAEGFFIHKIKEMLYILLYIGVQKYFKSANVPPISKCSGNSVRIIHSIIKADYFMIPPFHENGKECIFSYINVRTDREKNKFLALTLFLFTRRTGNLVKRFSREPDNKHNLAVVIHFICSLLRIEKWQLHRVVHGQMYSIVFVFNLVNDMLYSMSKYLKVRLKKGRAKLLGHAKWLQFWIRKKIAHGMMYINSFHRHRTF